MAVRTFAGVGAAVLLTASPVLAQTAQNQSLTQSTAARSRPAQPEIDTVYNPRETFAPRPYDEPVNVYRSSNGLPGPAYWQNRADYQIHATLNPDPVA